MRIDRKPLLTIAFVLISSIAVAANVRGGQPASSAAVDTSTVASASTAATDSTASKEAATTSSASTAPKDAATTPASPPVAAAPKLPLAGVDVLVDPGHGGTDPGAMRAGIEEKNITLAVSLSLRTKLRAQGARVEMTRESDVPVALLDRLADSNKLCPDLFLSVHVNAVRKATVTGIETYYFDKRSEPLANVVLDTLSSRLGENANWSHERSLRVLHENRAPATLAEIGYLTNPGTRDRLKSPVYQDKVADALARSLISYFAQPGVPRGCQRSGVN